jgi:hypothetical protein
MNDADTAPESFFASLVGCAPETALRLCEAQMDAWRRESGDVLRRRDALPRNDKKGAGDLLAEAQRIQSKMRRLRPALIAYKSEAARLEQHHLWHDAVKAVAGLDAHAACIAWMKAEKRKRAELLSRKGSLVGAADEDRRASPEGQEPGAACGMRPTTPTTEDTDALP